MEIWRSKKYKWNKIKRFSSGNLVNHSLLNNFDYSYFGRINSFGLKIFVTLTKRSRDP